MEIESIPSSWQALSQDDSSWLIQDAKGRKIAVVGKGQDAEENARLIAISPYILEALKGLVALIGDEDLDDNGDLSGAATCDMARQAVALAIG